MIQKSVLIVDAGRDQDDEDSLVLANLLIRKMILELLGVVANLAPSMMRARLTKGTLCQLGRPDVPVGVGTSCGQPEEDGLDYQFDVSYLAPAEIISPGEELLVEILKESPENSLVLVLLSGLTDAASLFDKQTELFRKKISRVAIMGGVVVEDGKAVLKDGLMLPDPTAQNNKFDLAAAEFLYRNLQLAGIPMVVLSRVAAAAAKVPRSIYDKMAATGHPVGIRLQKAQRFAIEELWRRANLPPEDPSRLLPERCNKQWFCQTFCGGDGLDRQLSDSIWDLVKTFQLYDPMTLIAAIPELSQRFYQPTIVEVRGTEHQLIGISKAKNGVKNPKKLSRFLEKSLVESLKKI